MNEPTREQFNPESQQEANEFLNERERLASQQEALRGLHNAEPGVKESKEQFERRLAEAAKAEGRVHHEVSPDFPLPENELPESKKIEMVSKLIEHGGEGYELTKELEDLFEQQNKQQNKEGKAA